LRDDVRRAKGVNALRYTHGGAPQGAHWPEYTAWKNMLIRCHDPRRKDYCNYGARGISVCDRWRFGENGKHGFACFLEDVGRKPSPELTIDRWPDNDGNYEPGNVRWATRFDQTHNRRKRAQQQEAAYGP
jgi:hypothetical protein